MTVIAYSSKHRILAADSRCSGGGVHLTAAQKVYRLKSGALLGLAGDVDMRDLVHLFEKASPRKLPTRSQINEVKSICEGLLVFPRGQVFYIMAGCSELAPSHSEWTSEVIPIKDNLVAVGSGSSFAYGAMEAGADPVKAVRAACRRDTACALPVQWEKLG